VEKAVGLARELGRLRDLKSGLRGRVEWSPLCAEERFVRGLEGAYGEMLQRAARGD
jgi:predicted O-linked N-acetylglucosamine transferase (SPINDLY family)